VKLGTGESREVSRSTTRLIGPVCIVLQLWLASSWGPKNYGRSLAPRGPLQLRQEPLPSNKYKLKLDTGRACHR